MTMYQEDVKKLARISMDGIIAAARKNVPLEYEHKPWSHPEVDHGRGLLQSEAGLDCYMAAYGKAHKEKAFKAISFLPLSEINDNFTLCDWGCGQGIASICFLEKIRSGKLADKLQMIRLIEPPSISCNLRHCLNLTR